jgi:PleD family two-component response regulator
MNSEITNIFDSFLLKIDSYVYIIKMPNKKKCKVCNKIKLRSDFDLGISKKKYLSRCKSCVLSGHRVPLIRNKDEELLIRDKKEDEALLITKSKMCNHCKREKPEYRFKKNGGGYENICKRCHNKNERIRLKKIADQRVVITQKHCPICDELKNVLEFYPRHTIDGYSMFCKKCANELRELLVSL